MIIPACTALLSNPVLFYTNDVFYPRGLCLSEDPNGSMWFQNLKTDTVLLDSLLSANQALSDHLSGGPESLNGHIYQLKAIRSLQDRISKPDVELASSDATIMAIVTLALSSEMFHSDYESTRKHLIGLNRLIAVRGGLQALTYAQHDLLSKICRSVAKNTSWLRMELD